MTYVINQGLALYWGTSRWSAAEIMVRDSDTPHPIVTVWEAGRWEDCSDPCLLSTPTQEAYSMARQFNLIPPVCEQAENHFFQREKVEMQLPELYHKIGVQTLTPTFPVSPVTT